MIIGGGNLLRRTTDWMIIGGVNLLRKTTDRMIIGWKPAKKDH